MVSRYFLLRRILITRLNRLKRDLICLIFFEFSRRSSRRPFTYSEKKQLENVYIYEIQSKTSYKLFHNMLGLLQQWTGNTETMEKICINYSILFDLISTLWQLLYYDNPRKLIFLEGARNDNPRFVRKQMVVASKNFAVFQEFQVYVERYRSRTAIWNNFCSRLSKHESLA